MKKLLAVVMLAATTLAGYSQTNSTSSFFQSVTTYFTSFNTNLNSTFGEAKGSVWVGLDSLQNEQTPLANSIGLSYRLAKRITAETVIRDAGITGAIVNWQGGFGLNVVVHDAQLTGYAHGGYDFIRNEGADQRFYCELGLRAAKALTEHTYAGVGLGVKLPNTERVFSVFAGFTF